MKKFLVFASVLSLASMAAADLTHYVPEANVIGTDGAGVTMTVSVDFFGQVQYDIPTEYQGTGGFPVVHAYEMVGSAGQMGTILGFDLSCGDVTLYVPSTGATFWQPNSIPMPGETLTMPGNLECGGGQVEANEIPVSFELKGAFPNPFNPTTTIEFALPTTEMVNLSVFNINGQLVNTLVSGAMDAGNHSVTFDASNLSSGVYLYTIEAGAFTATNKMVLVK
jgi:hypothetical protein